MGQFSYDDQMGERFLLYTLSEDETRDETTYGMLTNNEIDGVIPVYYTQSDDRRILKFRISMCQSVREMMKAPVKKDSVIQIFTSILRIMENAEDYLIPKESFVMDLDYVFVSSDFASVSMICLPLEKRTPDVSIGDFFKNFITSLSFYPGEDISYVGKIVNYLNNANVLRIPEFRTILNQLSPVPVIRPTEHGGGVSGRVNRPLCPPEKNKPEIPPARENIDSPVPPPCISSSFPVDNGLDNAESDDNISLLYLLQHYNKENAEKYKKQKDRKKATQGNKKSVKKKSGTVNKNRVLQKPKKDVAVPYAVPGMDKPAESPSPYPDSVVGKDLQGHSYSGNHVQVHEESYINFAELKGSDNETHVLNKTYVGENVYPILERMVTGEKITVDKPIFKIGKNRQENDCVIEGNDTVSRSHAHILCKDNAYYIIDDNSTNRTYVNGKIVQPGEERKIVPGDRIRLSNEEFQFREAD